MDKDPDIPERCPVCGGRVRLHQPKDDQSLGQGRREMVFRCSKGCVEYRQ